MASATMAQRQSSRGTCQECGAKLPPDVRYCLSCYSPVATESGSHPHTREAGAVNTTLRAEDPTIVFLPNERELIRKRSRRRRRLVLFGVLLLVVVTAGDYVSESVRAHW